MADSFEDVLATLARNDGACLYWQMPDSARAKAALKAGLIKEDGDLLVHPAAKMIVEGIAYAMPADADPHAICRKWVARLGGGFHPDTRGKDYFPKMDPAEIREYDADMDALFAVAADPYECAVMAMDDAGLL